VSDVASAAAPPITTTARLGLVLGVLSAIGPLSIDLYLPAFPTMARELAASPGEVQRTLSAFFLALAAAQIPIGSFGDRFGRKRPLYLGLGLFVLTSLACAVATSIDSLVALRFVQGFSVCAGTAVSRAIIRDVAVGPDAARLMAMTFLVIGISPVLAPLAGSYLLMAMSWRGLFVVLAGAGLAGLAIARFCVPESLPPERRLPPGAPLLRPYAALLANPRFIGAALVAGLATTVPYAYVTAAPFVFSGGFRLDAHLYGLALAANAVCSIGATQVSPTLMRRWGARRLVLRMSALGAALMAVLALLAGAGLASLPTFQAISMLVFCVTGLMLTPAAVSALDAGGARGAGAAAGALGTIQLVVTGLASGTISLFPAFSLFPLLGVVGGALALAGLLTLVTARD